MDTEIELVVAYHQRQIEMEDQHYCRVSIL